MAIKNKIRVAVILAMIQLVANDFIAAQATDSAATVLTFSGYIDIYYSYDFGRPANHLRPSFVYAYNRHNEVNLNLGFVKAAYQKNNIRANLALGVGTYMNANLAGEQGVLKNVFEANAGIKLSRKNNIWVDAGIFASHIGFESAIGKDCWNLTRSILADNSPYYESGVKISYTTTDEKWFISGLILNGWQHIYRPDGNNTPAFGHQLTWKPNSNIILNSSSFIGNDKPDSIKQMRYFHNFYAQVQIKKSFGIIAGFDIGAQQKAKLKNGYDTWYSPVLIGRFRFCKKSNIAARVEYYSDENGVIIRTGTPNGFKTWGYSINYDYQIRDHVLWRIEGRMLSGKDKIFSKDNIPSNTDFFMTTSLAVSF